MTCPECGAAIECRRLERLERQAEKITTMLDAMGAPRKIGSLSLTLAERLELAHA